MPIRIAPRTTSRSPRAFALTMLLTAFIAAPAVVVAADVTPGSYSATLTLTLWEDAY